MTENMNQTDTSETATADVNPLSALLTSEFQRVFHREEKPKSMPGITYSVDQVAEDVAKNLRVSIREHFPNGLSLAEAKDLVVRVARAVRPKDPEDKRGTAPVASFESVPLEIEALRGSDKRTLQARDDAQLRDLIKRTYGASPRGRWAADGSTRTKWIAKILADMKASGNPS